MSSLVFDVETDGLDATKIWCLSTCDTSTEELNSYYGNTLQEGLSKLQEADKLIGHNIIGFDIPVIHKLVVSFIQPSSGRQSWSRIMGL